MRIKVGFESITDVGYTYLIEDLVPFSPCVVTRDGSGVTVEAEGDVVKCMSVVAICDRYKYGGKEDE